jgi:predicted MPP superfamily phosphohydrolase
MRTILFPIILLLIVSLVEFYTYKAITSNWGTQSKRWKKGMKVVHISLMSLSLIGFLTLFIVGRNMPSWLLNFFFGFVTINFISKILFSTSLLVDDLRRISKKIFNYFRKTPKVHENGISRSTFLLKTGAVVAAVPVVSLTSGMFIGPYRYTLHHPKVNLPNLPAAFDGLKIVQISDIHSGSFYNKKAVNRGIDMLLEQKPDIIFFTGDLVNDSAEEMDDYMDVFSRLSAPLGVYSILGNHDYGDYREWESEEAKAANLVRLKEIHAELGWRLLLDEHVYIERGEDKIGLIGVQNWGTGFHQEGDLAKAAKNCKAPVKLLLSHDPTHWDEQVTKDYTDINITFSGHTHGMQMGVETGGFKWSPISLRYAKWAGLYQNENQFLYVNRGYGFLGYPGRIGIWPEITVMTLHKSSLSNA